MSGPATVDTTVPSAFLSVTVRVVASIASTVPVSVRISDEIVLAWAMAVRAVDTRTTAAMIPIPTTNRFIRPPGPVLTRVSFSN